MSETCFSDSVGCWPLLAFHCDVIIHLASPQTFEYCTSLTAASDIVPSMLRERCLTSPPVLAILAIRSNQSYCHFFLPWEGSHFLWRIPRPLETWLVAKGGDISGDSSWCSLFLLVDTAARTYAMGNVQAPKKEEGIHFLTDLPAWCSPSLLQRKSSHSSWSLLTHIIYHHKFTSWPLNMWECACFYYRPTKIRTHE